MIAVARCEVGGGACGAKYNPDLIMHDVRPSQP